MTLCAECSLKYHGLIEFGMGTCALCRAVREEWRRAVPPPKATVVVDHDAVARRLIESVWA